MNKENKDRKRLKSKFLLPVANIKHIKYFISFAVISVLFLTSFIFYSGISLSDLADLSFYENLANPSMRIVNVREGLRKEEIADVLETKLGWNKEKKDEFLNAHLALGRENLEGYFFPKSYFIHKDTTPVDVAQLMINTFEEKTKNIKKQKNTKIINEETILKIASIIQRESGGKRDMNLISGIIWNRIFDGMKLQIDATLQYAKGNEDLWWPRVVPNDKNIDSPYNTYLHKDLPPSPIANPGLAAIAAAYNPAKTSCIFYLHDKKGNIHCTKTYEEHKKNIERYY